DKLVFGSGGARQVPDGFDHWEARKQIVEFARMAGEIAAQHGRLLVVEALRSRECNIVNTMAEASQIVREGNHPNVQCLFDTYHFWSEGEALDNLSRAAPLVRHVHVADLEGRVAPGESGASDYRPAFAILKQSGYDDTMSVEASGFTDISGTGKRVLAFL